MHQLTGADLKTIEAQAYDKLIIDISDVQAILVKLPDDGDE